MANVLVYQNQDSLSLTRLRDIPGLELIDGLSSSGKKLWLHNEAWPRDQIIWLEGVAHETLNRRGGQQYVISSLLEARGVEVRTDRYLPFQGGHILQTAEHIFCATSCAIDQQSHQDAFDRGHRLPWGLESLERFKGGESVRFIHRYLPNAIALPSLTGLPWSYHADLSVAFLGKLALVSDPSLFTPAMNSSVIEIGLQEVERILSNAGYEPLRFPLFYEPEHSVFHAPLNGLNLNGCFYYTLIEGMAEFNEFVKDFISKKIPSPTEAVLLPPELLGRGGGLRCLSLEW